MIVDHPAACVKAQRFNVEAVFARRPLGTREPAIAVRRPPTMTGAIPGSPDTSPRDETPSAANRLGSSRTMALRGWAEWMMTTGSADRIPAPAHERAAITVAVGGLCTIAAAIGIGRFVYTPILPPMMTALGLSKSEAGMIASANFLGYLIGALAAATPTLPGARRHWVLGALAISALTTAAMGFAETLAPFLMLRFVGGAASAFVLIIGSTIVLEYLVEVARAELSAMHFAGVGSGIAVSAALVAGLAQFGESWRVLWIASGALSLAAVAPAMLLPHHPGSVPLGGAETRTALDQRLKRLIVAYGFFGFGYVITATFLVAIVRGAPAIRVLEPLIWVVFGLAAVPSVALWTWIARLLGVRRSFALACVVEAGGVLASVAWQTLPGVFVATLLVGGTFMGLTALGLIEARALAKGDPRRALALMTGAFGFGQIIGPVFAGILSDRLGSFAAASEAAGAALLIAAWLAK
jgi:predicted MFS family arabinose efflux permease